MTSSFDPRDGSKHAALAEQFCQWTDQHRGIIVKVSRAYTLTKEDCQDLAQEILLQIWRSLPHFQGKSSSSTWVYRVALNTALDWKRLDIRRVPQQAAVAIEDLAIDSSEHAERAEGAELVERLYAAIRSLPKADAALMLLYLDEFSYRAIAEILGMTESNVGVKLNRLKKTLADFMKEHSHAAG